MNWLRLASLVFVAAILAGCLSYFVTLRPPAEPEQRLLPAADDYIRLRARRRRPTFSDRTSGCSDACLPLGGAFTA
jgi:hypothetical protein